MKRSSTTPKQPNDVEPAEIQDSQTTPTDDAQDTEVTLADETQNTGTVTANKAQALVKEAGKRIAELTNDLQRTRADFENYRKQIEIQKNQSAQITRLATVNKFLPLIDNFERAIQSYPEQLAPLAKSFDKTLQEVGLTRINSEAGTEFNPDLHEAVMVEDGDGDTEVVTETLRPGYTYDGAVVRTAMVKVKHQ